METSSRFFFKLTYRISSHFSEKASKDRFFGLDKLQNDTSEGKKKGEKERARRKKGEKEEKKKKIVVALLVFITAALAKKKKHKKLSVGKGPFGGNIF